MTLIIRLMTIQSLNLDSTITNPIDTERELNILCNLRPMLKGKIHHLNLNFNLITMTPMLLFSCHLHRVCAYQGVRNVSFRKILHMY